MPTYRTGDMWDNFGNVDWFLFTANPIVNKEGLAVMGRGMALDLAKQFPEIRSDFAKKLRRTSLERHVGTVGYYGAGPTKQRVGFFMVKNHWREPAMPYIIRQSCMELAEILDSVTEVYGLAPTVDLNYPGIGNGELTKEQVKPILDEMLPSNVHVWSFD